MSACRSCGAEVRWVKSEASGKAMILDAVPCKRGNVFVFPEGQDWRARVFANAAELRAHLPAGYCGFVDHHATCPDAKKWRKE